MGGEWCSLTVLCLGAVASLSAMALVSIGVTTDHWTLTRVDRTSVKEHGEGNNSGYMYYTRHRGIFRICFPEQVERPAESSPGLYLNLVDDWCYSREYYLSNLTQGVLRPQGISDHANTQLQLMRSTPVLLCAYLISMLFVGLLGLCGCWQQSANKLITTAAFQLISALVGACAMATWHAALFFEMEKVHDPGFPLSWPLWLQEVTRVETSWSYILSWVGVCLTLIASLLTSAAAICLRSRRSRDWEDDTMRMKLKMSRMFAQHAYFPPESRSSPAYSDRNYPTMPANFPTHHINNGAKLAEFENESFQRGERVHDYRKVVSQLQDSKF